MNLTSLTPLLNVRFDSVMYENRQMIMSNRGSPILARGALATNLEMLCCLGTCKNSFLDQADI